MLSVVRGHEIWVLADASHAHQGSEARCRIFFGHAMHPDGLADPERLSAWAVAPDGNRISLEVKPGEGNHHLVEFTPDQEGFWAVAVEFDVGPIVTAKDGFHRRGTREDYPDALHVEYYYQYAKTFVQVGHFCASCREVEHPPEIICLGHELELIVAPGAYRIGDEVALKVLYQGQPLPGTEVKAIWSLWEDEDWPLSLKTNDSGEAKFVLTNPGHWLFYTCHADDSLRKEGKYDKRVYSATVSIFGVRKRQQWEVNH